ncbi:MAG: hypothetical protein IT179_16410 [Acidobacteria bacterium]|nr:hypothetical protein [Acidobacteriota bacterium]
MKTIIKLLVAAILVTIAVQGGRAALKHYAFVDALQEAMLFAGSRTEEELSERVLEIAADHEIPLDPAALTVRRLPFQVTIDAPYTDTVDLLPGLYQRTWDFDTSVQVRLLEDTRPRGGSRSRR